MGIPGPRVIPAWAGNTETYKEETETDSGHPRVGGEHLRLSDTAMNYRGSSPRGRGTQRHIKREALQRQTYGSSPRGRGTRAADGVGVAQRRVIPAWAGNTVRNCTSRMGTSGHPRVGGEHRQRAADRSKGNGSSPRGRGTLGMKVAMCFKGRVIPAWAGNTTLATLASPPAVVGSSPRGRGTPSTCGGAFQR